MDKPLARLLKKKGRKDRLQQTMQKYKESEETITRNDMPIK